MDRPAMDKRPLLLGVVCSAAFSGCAHQAECKPHVVREIADPVSITAKFNLTEAERQALEQLYAASREASTTEANPCNEPIGIL